MPSKIEEVLHGKIGPVFRGPGDDDVVAIDTETYYDKEYGLQELGTYSYITDRRFDPYLVSVVARDLEYVGPLKDCPWDKITNRPWVAHNMSFDAQVLIEAQKRGMIPDWVEPAALDCTADLAVFLKAPRNLAGAVRELFGETMEKETRDLMKGKTWQDAVDAGLKDQLVLYALNDSRFCYRLARDFGKQWLEQEIRISRLNRKAGSIGIHVNLKAVRDAIRSLQHSIYIAGDSIPWEWGGPKQNKTPLSLDKAREQCRVDGIPCPTTFKEDSEEASDWEERYADKHPWIKAIRHWRKANRVLKLLKSIEARTRPDGTMPYLIKYFGAHTGRFSGGDGVNMQNLPKYPFEQTSILEGEDESYLREIDVRPMFIAPPGGTLFIADLSQIEARVILHLAGDKRQLQAIREGFNVYEAHARTTMGWSGGPLKAERPDLYALAKARCLSGDTLILTSRGYVPISEIALDDMVWDGVSFVAHGGVVQSGVKPTVGWRGDRYTHDHKIFCDKFETVEARMLRERKPSGWVSRYRRQSSPRNEVRLLAAAVHQVFAGARREAFALFKVFMRALWDRALGRLEQFKTRKNLYVSGLRG